MNEIKALQKAYKKRTKSLQQELFKRPSTGIQLLVESLRYKRDLIVLTEDYENDLELRAQLATIIAAIKEFEAYEKSVASADTVASIFHWDSFCEFTRQNFLEWYATT